MNLRLSRRWRRFCDDVDGGITALTVTVFLVMVVSVGMAVDFMRHEIYRAELQDALDRGVLASAAFNQTVAVDDTIDAYLQSTNFVKHCYQLHDRPIKPTLTTGTRTIKAAATCELNTFFLKLVGIPKLNVNAVGTAVDGASKVEVSLVLDISTSMVIENSGDAGQTRLEVLQSSANDFLDAMFSPINNDRLSMSLIPFAGQVNAGPNALAYFDQNSIHNYSHCIEFEGVDLDFVPNNQNDTAADPRNTMTRTPLGNSRTQMQHFNYSIYPGKSHGPPGKSNVDWGWCPSDMQQIAYFQTDKEALKTRINALRTHEATGTFHGARWGAMLLDPSSHGLTDALIAAGEVENSEYELPRTYSDKEVHKFLIIMGDGATTSQLRVVAREYDTPAKRGRWARQLSANQNNDFQYVDVSGEPITNGPTVDGGWTTDPAVASRENARIAFRQVCETARDNGIVIYTIGFDLDPAPGETDPDLIEASLLAKDDLAACAERAGNFHNVKGPDELAGAFSEIAATIQKLRLLN